MVIKRGDTAVTQFLNVDLDVYSKGDLQPLAAALGKAVIVLHVGRIKRTYDAHFELVKLTKTADATIREFCSLIQRLPRAARQVWNDAKVRDFNIGVQSEVEPLCTEFVLEAPTIRAACELGARIVFSVYAPEKGRRSGVKAKSHGN